jgi:hypothetical protein
MKLYTAPNVVDPIFIFIFFLDPDSDPALASVSANPDEGFRSGLLMKNTLEFTSFFLKAQRILQPYLNCRSSKLREKANF